MNCQASASGSIIICDNGSGVSLDPHVHLCLQAATNSQIPGSVTCMATQLSCIAVCQVWLCRRQLPSVHLPLHGWEAVAQV